MLGGHLEGEALITALKLEVDQEGRVGDPQGAGAPRLQLQGVAVLQPGLPAWLLLPNGGTSSRTGASWLERHSPLGPAKNQTPKLVQDFANEKADL